jgi:urea transport system ATP-binding protein
MKREGIASDPLLRIENLTVSFDGFKAVDGMNLSVGSKEVRVLIGPNGAGKSTLMDAIIGRVRAASGKVFFKGEDITRLAEYKIARRGICRKFQAPGILENLSVFENLLLAAQKNWKCWSSFRRNVSPVVLEHARELLGLIALKDKRNSSAGTLAHGQKQWLEIGMVVASDADLLLLDEPAAGMSHGEAAQTADLIRRLSQWHSFVVIDHDMDFIEQLDAPVTVLHMGRCLREGSLEEIRSDREVTAIYLGRAREAADAGA